MFVMTAKDLAYPHRAVPEVHDRVFTSVATSLIRMIFATALRNYRLPGRPVEPFLRGFGAEFALRFTLDTESIISLMVVLVAESCCFGPHAGIDLMHGRGDLLRGRADFLGRRGEPLGGFVIFFAVL
jgi:hypothetical protein